jgi:hypothetical protein
MINLSLLKNVNLPNIKKQFGMQTTQKLYRKSVGFFGALNVNRSVALTRFLLGGPQRLPSIYILVGGRGLKGVNL